MVSGSGLRWLGFPSRSTEATVQILHERAPDSRLRNLRLSIHRSELSSDPLQLRQGYRSGRQLNRLLSNG